MEQAETVAAAAVGAEATTDTAAESVESWVAASRAETPTVEQPESAPTAGVSDDRNHAGQGMAAEAATESVSAAPVEEPTLPTGGSSLAEVAEALTAAVPSEPTAIAFEAHPGPESTPTVAAEIAAAAETETMAPTSVERDADAAAPTTEAATSPAVEADPLQAPSAADSTEGMQASREPINPGTVNQGADSTTSGEPVAVKGEASEPAAAAAAAEIAAAAAPTEEAAASAQAVVDAPTTDRTDEVAAIHTVIDPAATEHADVAPTAKGAAEPAGAAAAEAAAPEEADRPWWQH